MLFDIYILKMNIIPYYWTFYVNGDMNKFNAISTWPSESYLITDEKVSSVLNTLLTNIILDSNLK